jgi:hypothetical protein
MTPKRKINIMKVIFDFRDNKKRPPYIVPETLLFKNSFTL